MWIPSPPHPIPVFNMKNTIRLPTRFLRTLIPASLFSRFTANYASPVPHNGVVNWKESLLFHDSMGQILLCSSATLVARNLLNEAKRKLAGMYAKNVDAGFLGARMELAGAFSRRRRDCPLLVCYIDARFNNGRAQ
ncbi:hypothetical protein ACHAW6_012601 [Cyclotella cf. meneghiniana]